jgi:hypothetical protein
MMCFLWIWSICYVSDIHNQHFIHFQYLLYPNQAPLVSPYPRFFNLKNSLLFKKLFFKFYISLIKVSFSMSVKVIYFIFLIKLNHEDTDQKIYKRSQKITKHMNVIIKISSRQPHLTLKQAFIRIKQSLFYQKFIIFLSKLCSFSLFFLLNLQKTQKPHTKKIKY